MVAQVRHILREATAAAHQRLHDHPVLAPLSTGTLTRAHYIRGLLAFYGLHSAADRALVRLWPERAARAAVIAADLRALGIGPDRLVTAGTLPVYDTPACALGLRYVVDGSGFGVQSMAANIQRTLGLTADTGSRFFHGDSIDQAGEWRGLLTSLEALTTPAERELARNAAMATFAGIERWLDHCAAADPQGTAQ